MNRASTPGNPELAIGALAEDGEPYLNEDGMSLTAPSQAYLDGEIARQRSEIARRRQWFRNGRALTLPPDATVILVDDGVATGATVIAAIHALRAKNVKHLVLAVRVQLTLAPAEEPLPVTHPGPVPADQSNLTDREIEFELRELVKADTRVDTEELRIVCRHGIVHLDGALPSKTEHDIVRKLVSDVAGMREIVDHVRIEEIAWESPERTKTSEAAPSAEAVDETGDIVRSTEEGIEYSPPSEPLPEPEK